MGPASVADPAALVSALKSQQPASNPKTPLERLNPDQQILENIKAASVSLERAQQFTNDDNLIMVLNAMGGVLSKALLKFDGQQVMQALRDAVGTFPPPVAPGMGAAPGAQAPGAPGAPPGAPPAATAGMPSQPPAAAPSPGVPPQ
jgi:preprotein translocase subunit SecD